MALITALFGCSVESEDSSRAPDPMVAPTDVGTPPPLAEGDRTLVTVPEVAGKPSEDGAANDRAGKTCVLGAADSDSYDFPPPSLPIGDASENAFTAMASELDRAYQQAGIDNNYVATRYYDAADYATLVEGKPVTELAPVFKLVQALRTCVFPTQGAYGDHLETQDTAWLLALDWAQRLGTHPEFVRAERIEGARLLDYEIVSSACAVAVRDTSGRTLVMQGMGVD